MCVSNSANSAQFVPSNNSLDYIVCFFFFGISCLLRDQKEN